MWDIYLLEREGGRERRERERDGEMEMEREREERERERERCRETRRGFVSERLTDT